MASTCQPAQGIWHRATCLNQAFSIGDKIFGFQFHAEVTPTVSCALRRARAQYGKPGAQTREEQNRLMRLHDAAQAAWFEGFLEKLFPRQN